MKSSFRLLYTILFWKSFNILVPNSIFCIGPALESVGGSWFWSLFCNWSSCGRAYRIGCGFEFSGGDGSRNIGLGLRGSFFGRILFPGVWFWSFGYRFCRRALQRFVLCLFFLVLLLRVGRDPGLMFHDKWKGRSAKRKIHPILHLFPCDWGSVGEFFRILLLCIVYSGCNILRFSVRCSRNNFWNWK